MAKKITVNETEITVLSIDERDYISLTDMIKAKEGDFFISSWLRNRNTVEYLGVWEQIHERKGINQNQVYTNLKTRIGLALQDKRHTQ